MTFKRKTDAQRWIQDTESAIRDGRYFKKSESRRHTVEELIDRFIEVELPQKPKMFKEYRGNLPGGKNRLVIFFSQIFLHQLLFNAGSNSAKRSLIGVDSCPMLESTDI